MKAYGVDGEHIKSNMVIPYKGFDISVSNILTPSTVGVFFAGESDLYFDTFDKAIEYIHSTIKRVELLTD